MPADKRRASKKTTVRIEPSVNDVDWLEVQASSPAMWGEIGSRARAVCRSLRATRAALIRLLQDSVADDASCTCEADDLCPQCQAMMVLGLGRWFDAKRSEDLLSKVKP